MIDVSFHDIGTISQLVLHIMQMIDVSFHMFHDIDTIS